MEQSDNYMPVPDISNLFPNLDLETIGELIGNGFGRQREITIGFDEETGEELFKEGICITFKSLDVEEAELKINVDKDTGKIYSLSQHMPLPINIYPEANAWIELFYSYYDDDTPWLEVSFNSGEVFQKIVGVEGLENFYIGTTVNPGYTDNPYESKLTFMYRGRSSIHILPGENNVTAVSVIANNRLITDYTFEGEPFTTQFQNYYPINLFRSQDNPWQTELSLGGNSMSFKVTIPNVLEIYGGYRLELTPSILESMKNGMHRPIIPIWSQTRML